MSDDFFYMLFLKLQTSKCGITVRILKNKNELVFTCLKSIIGLPLIIYTLPHGG